MEAWFRRMADIPGLSFAGSPGVDRRALRDADLRPRVEHGYLSWPMSGGSTSASPAHQRAFGDMSGLGCRELVRYVWEGLEVPGEPSDYHFLLQNAVERLWSDRDADPENLVYVEGFAYLDLQLAEAVPAAVSYERDGGQRFYRISSVERLVRLLEREGALREALSVADRARRLGQREWPDLEVKVVALDEELR